LPEAPARSRRPQGWGCRDRPRIAAEARRPAKLARERLIVDSSNRCKEAAAANGLMQIVEGCPPTLEFLSHLSGSE